MDAKIAILIIIGCLFFLGFLSMLFGSRQEDRAVRDKMRQQGRYEEWEKFVQRLRAGQGTVILNRTNLSGRLWWTAETIANAHQAISAIQSGGAIFTVPPILFRPTEARLRQLGAINVIVSREAVRS